MGRQISTAGADEQVAPAAADAGPRPSQIRLRAFIAALVIIPIDNYWVLMMEKVREGPYPTTISIFANAVFVLAALAALNHLLRKLNPRLAFSSAEMLLIYAMTAVSAALAGHDMLPSLVGMVGCPWRFAPYYGWNETFMGYLPTWLSVTDTQALKGLYEGGSSLYADGYWLFWVKPTLWWLSFMVGLAYVMMCINTIVRKQWIERERLQFPIVQLPVSMTEPGGAIWRNKLFWMGFAIAFGIDFLNGLAFYFPAIPAIDVGFQNHDLASGLVDKPWSAVGWVPYTFYPFAIGLGYLLPADLCFSSWFFYLFFKLQMLLAATFGAEVSYDMVYAKEQAFGGLLAIVVTMAWAGKGYLKQVWLKVLGAKSELDDSDEAMSYRAAVVGGLAGVAFLSWFMLRIGLSPILAISAFVLYFIIATAIARIRAELGPPVHDFHFSGPDTMLMSSLGTGRMSNYDLVGLRYFWWFNRAYRAHPMPITTEAVKMADVRKASQRKFFWGIMIAIAVGTIATFWVYLDIGYRLGFSSKVAQGGVYSETGFYHLNRWFLRPDDMANPNWGSNGGIVAGFAFCMLLSYLRLNVANIPFNPIGFAISASWEINLVWVPLLIAWTIKTAMLKFGGLKLYKTALPFFLGLILGEMIIGCVWSIIGITFNIPYYNFWGA